MDHHRVTIASDMVRATFNKEVEAGSLPGAICTLTVPCRHTLVSGRPLAMIPEKLCHAVADAMVPTVSCRALLTPMAMVPFRVQGFSAAAAVSIPSGKLAAATSWP